MARIPPRRRRAKSIGDVIKANGWVIITCGNCKTIAYVKPETLHLKPNVELDVLAKFYPCPQCNYSNGENDEALVAISTE